MISPVSLCIWTDTLTLSSSSCRFLSISKAARIPRRLLKRLEVMDA